MPTTRLGWLAEAPTAYRQQLVDLLTPEERDQFEHQWTNTARPEQLPPAGDWRIWLMLAGRGFGKTRAGAEWVRQVAETNPDARIALVSASLNEARAVMVEGESGILTCSRSANTPRYESTMRRLVFPNGARAQLFSAAEPEALRGPEHSHAAGPGPEGVLCE